MTWFRVGGAGVPAALKNAMNAVFNKKFGTTGQNYPPNQWPDDVNLLGPLPEKTASGSVATFDDGADAVPISSGVFYLNYKSGGYTEMNIFQTGKNLIGLPEVNFTLKGVRFYTVNGVLYLDGSTVGEISSTDDAFKNNLRFYLPAGTYYFNRGAIALPSYIYDVNNMTSGNAIRTNNGSFTLSEGKVLALGFYLYQKTFSDAKFDGMVNPGSTSQTYVDAISPVMKNVGWVSQGAVYGGYFTSQTGILMSTKASDGSTLAEPVEIVLDPVNIETMLGSNSFFCDSGDSSITYRADIDLLLAALQNSRSLSASLMRSGGPDLEERSEDPEEVSELEENIQNTEEQEGEDDAR